MIPGMFFLLPQVVPSCISANLIIIDLPKLLEKFIQSQRIKENCMNVGVDEDTFKEYAPRFTQKVLRDEIPEVTARRLVLLKPSRSYFYRY